MMKKLDELHWDQMKDPEYQMIFSDMQKEFDRAQTLIKLRSRARITPNQNLMRIKTSPRSVSRLERSREILVLSKLELKSHFMKLYFNLLSPLVFLSLPLFLALILLLAMVAC